MPKKIKISELVPDAKNANKGTPRGAGMVADSLSRYGGGRSLLVDANNRIIAGNTTAQAALEVGMDEARVVETDGTELVVVRRTDLDLDSEQGRGLAIMDNRTSELGLTWDPGVLGELQADGLELSQFWHPSELDALGLPTLDDMVEGSTGEKLGSGGEERPERPTTRRGDVWQLGDHRVMCGDATDLKDVATLMDGEKALMVFTDPPYNLASENILFGGSISDRLDRLKGSDWDKGFDITGIFPAIDSLAGEACSIYVCTSHHLAGKIWGWMAETCAHSSFCVWHKTNPMPSLAKRHWTFATELICYGTRGKHCFNFPPAGHALNVWPISRAQATTDHPTEKPTELAKHAISHSSEHGDLVVDLFLGSGCTLIAADETGRACYGMEMDPGYVDLIVQRWEGSGAEHRQAALVTGQVFSEVSTARLASD